MKLFSYYKNKNHELRINYLAVWISENSSGFQNRAEIGETSQVTSDTELSQWTLVRP